MAAMLSLSPSKFAGSAGFFTPHNPRRRPISSAAAAGGRIPPSPPPAPPGRVYQPFRRPPSQLPSKHQTLDPAARLEILRDRLGLWHEYAPLISSLLREGFTPSSIEEATGITGVDQNRLIVAAQVRDSLLSSPSFSSRPDLLASFDHPTGADLLYEIRLLNTVQRAAAAIHAVEHRLDGKGAQELARAVKDFPRRRGDAGWDRFSGSSPRDCLAYTYLRLSREATSPAERAAALDKAMEAVETEEGRRRIEDEMGGKEEVDLQGDGYSSGRVVVPVVRLRYGEVAEATTVRLLPVCKEEDGEAGLLATPVRCEDEGRMGVVTAEREWGRWVVLPGWEPVAGAEEGVVVEFADARVLPWRANRWEKEEGVLAVVDRRRREVAEEYGFYLVAGGEGGRLQVERGRMLREEGVKEALGTVVLVVRPPMEQENENPMAHDDWE